MAASMRSQLKLLVSQGRRPWSYPILNSSLSSTRSDPPQQIPHPTGDHPADKAGDTPAVQQPPPAPAVSDLDHLPSHKHIGRDGALVTDPAGKPKLGSSTSFPRQKKYDPVGGYSFHEES
ncbi:hypothetical protein ACQJBY_034581 [Aegilops geniculata]